MPIPPRLAYLGAPYGIYATSDGYVALAMGSVTDLGKLLQCHALAAYTDAKTWFTARDEIKRILAIHLAGHTTAHWLAILEPAGYWSSNVLTWPELMATEAFKRSTCFRRSAAPAALDGIRHAAQSALTANCSRTTSPDRAWAGIPETF